MKLPWRGHCTCPSWRCSIKSVPMYLAVAPSPQLQPVQHCKVLFLMTCRPWLQSIHHYLLACIATACCCCELYAWHYCMQLLLLLVLLMPRFSLLCLLVSATALFCISVRSVLVWLTCFLVPQKFSLCIADASWSACTMATLGASEHRSAKLTHVNDLAEQQSNACLQTFFTCWHLCMYRSSFVDRP